MFMGTTNTVQASKMIVIWAVIIMGLACVYRLPEIRICSEQTLCDKCHTQSLKNCTQWRAVKYKIYTAQSILINSLHIIICVHIYTARGNALNTIYLHGERAKNIFIFYFRRCFIIMYVAARTTRTNSKN